MLFIKIFSFIYINYDENIIYIICFYLIWSKFVRIQNIGFDSYFVYFFLSRDSIILYILFLFYLFYKRGNEGLAKLCKRSDFF